MGFFKDVVSFGTRNAKSVNSFVGKNAAGIPIVGGLLLTATDIQTQQLNAIDKAIGNTPKNQNNGSPIDGFTNQEIQQNLEDAKALKAMQDEELKNSKKREKIIIYSFVGFGAISVGTIVYLIMKKNK